MDTNPEMPRTIDDAMTEQERQRIRKNVRVNRTCLYVVSAFFSLLAVGFLIALSVTPELQQTLPMVLIGLLACLSLGLIFGLVRPELRKYAKIEAMILQTRPVRMFVTNWSILTMQGTVCELTDSPQNPQIRIFGIFGLGKQNILPKQTPVEFSVYFDPAEIQDSAENDLAASPKNAKRMTAAIASDQHAFLGSLRPELTLSELPRLVTGMVKTQTVGFGSLFLFLFIGMCFVQNENYAKLSLAKQTRNWPSATATIEKSAVKQVTIHKGKSSYPGYEFDVLYRYAVDGTTYENGVPWVDYKAEEKEYITKQLAKRYPKGHTAPIFYNPSSPMQSVLEQGHEEAIESKMHSVWIFMGILSLAIGIVELNFWLNRRKLLQYIAALQQEEQAKEGCSR